MTEYGKVIGTEQNYAVVRVARREECAKCGMCGMKKNAANVDFKATNDIGAKEGDSVVISAEKNTVLLSSLLVFLAPLLLLAAEIGICYALNAEEVFILLLCVGTLALWFIILALVDKRISKIRGFCPTIVKIIKSEEKGEVKDAQTD